MFAARPEAFIVTPRAPWWKEGAASFRLSLLPHVCTHTSATHKNLPNDNGLKTIFLNYWLGLMVHTSYPSAQEAEVGDCEFESEVGLDHIVKLCFKRPKRKGWGL